MDFSFLKNTTLNKVEDINSTNTTTSTKKVERNPTNGASLRLFKDGSIYPSQQCVDKYNLEYFNTSSEFGNTTGHYGFDIIDSRKWSQYPQDAQPVVFIAAVPKKSGLVDLFASAKLENTSVMTQGSKTFGAELITMLQEVYNVEDLFATQKYVDLQIVEDVTLPSLDGIYNVPKVVGKGADKGQATTKRRENITVNPLTLFVDDMKKDIDVGRAENNEVITAEVAENVEEEVTA